ncbi:hypothetical protein H9Q69_010267 [Fusarium xylarioides]|nr:hypothetical protein H9Q70_009878 [Fusarium xylarioides]KAG5776607.1 hypothetical protein H9Q73_009704 [Fusarium xylarioides]KAG5790676.1 hypothetical protein H9Q69_010267 [Fusarium xylarioides]KAG5810170.1 hypothetical protein H9Q71_005651 [Fusarium xylarioides]KAG5824548.1 hypothetical protein H9Q74_005352 [Fusarium xylarioides]
MSSREYPAWFWRLRDLQQDRKARGQQNRYYDSNLPVEPKDFDEDLSESSECSNDSNGTCSSEKGCKYDEDDMCLKHDIEDQSSESSELSDVSGETSTTEAGYYALKEQREERKSQLKVWKRQGMSERQNESLVEEARQADIKNEEHEIQKVKAALAKTEKSPKNKSGPLKSLEDRLFRLFSTDHMQYCYHTHCPATYIEFYAPEDASPSPDDSGRRDPVEGHVYLIFGDACNIDPFVRPKYPSTKFHQLKVDRGRRTVDVQFFHEHFLVLRMHRDIVFSHQGIQPPMDAPEIFTYYGYDEDYEFPDDRRKEKAKRRRSASPQ